jgi:hypothetical protein
MSSATLSRLDHDELVLHEAMELLALGYKVTARLEGLFEPPDTIYGYRPDVIAVLGAKVVIVEVKKGDVDWPKLVALQRYAAEHPDLKLQIIE